MKEFVNLTKSFFRFTHFFKKTLQKLTTWILNFSFAPLFQAPKPRLRNNEISKRYVFECRWVRVMFRSGSVNWAFRSVKGRVIGSKIEIFIKLN